MALNTLGIIKNGTKIKIPAVFVPEPQESVSVTTDGMKTYGTLLNELYALADWTKLKGSSFLAIDSGTRREFYNCRLVDASTLFFVYSDINETNGKSATWKMCLYSSGSKFVFQNGEGIITDYSNNKPLSGKKYVIYY